MKSLYKLALAGLCFVASPTFATDDRDDNRLPAASRVEEDRRVHDLIGSGQSTTNDAEQLALLIDMLKGSLSEAMAAGRTSLTDVVPAVLAVTEHNATILSELDGRLAALTAELARTREALTLATARKEHEDLAMRELAEQLRKASEGVAP